MNDPIRDSCILGWLRGVLPLLRWWQHTLSRWRKKLQEWTYLFFHDISKAPLVWTGAVLLMAVGTNLLWILLLGRPLPPYALAKRAALCLLALFLMSRRMDWEALSSDSRFIQWLRRR